MARAMSDREAARCILTVLIGRSELRCLWLYFVPSLQMKLCDELVF